MPSSLALGKCHCLHVITICFHIDSLTERQVPAHWILDIAKGKSDWNHCNLFLNGPQLFSLTDQCYMYQTILLSLSLLSNVLYLYFLSASTVCDGLRFYVTLLAHLAGPSYYNKYLVCSINWHCHYNKNISIN